MSATMVERVRGAIITEMARQLDVPQNVEAILPRKFSFNMDLVALAALRAIREPNLRMLNAGWGAGGAPGLHWQAMIDAAIAEAEGGAA